MIRHRLTRADLRALATGPVNADLVTRLRASELSSRLMVLEAIRRRLRRTGAPGAPAEAEQDSREFEAAFASLARRDRVDPVSVRRLLSRPHFGAWTNRSLRTLDAGGRIDLPYFIRLARMSRDIPTDTERLRIALPDAGLELDVALDHADPQLDLYGARAAKPGAAETRAWRQRLTGALRLIVRVDPVLAHALTTGLTTIVPLLDRTDGRPRSATSGWAFGAIALSLPPDAESCADGLVHEFRHALLGVVDDHVPLLVPNTDELYYSPWREDPRPLSGLLFGCHAYVGLIDLWRRRADTGKIARWLGPTATAAEHLWDSDALSEGGRILVAALRERLREWSRPWGGEPAADVARCAADAAADHRLRWRLRHLEPDPGALRELAEAWIDGHHRVSVPVRSRVVAEPVRPLPPGPRARLLELGCGGYGDAPPALHPADRALLDGRYAEAAEAYEHLIVTGDDSDAWAGIALCRLRLRTPGPLAHRPEVVAGLHARLLARTGRRVAPGRLDHWLAEHSS
jgi:hypothetical protein